MAAAFYRVVFCLAFTTRPETLRHLDIVLTLHSGWRDPHDARGVHGTGVDGPTTSKARSRGYDVCHFCCGQRGAAGDIDCQLCPSRCLASMDGRGAPRHGLGTSRCLDSVLGRPGIGAGGHLSRQPENIDRGRCARRVRTSTHHDFCAGGQGASLWTAGLGSPLHAVEVAPTQEWIPASRQAGATTFTAIHCSSPLGPSSRPPGVNREKITVNFLEIEAKVRQRSLDELKNAEHNLLLTHPARVTSVLPPPKRK